MQRRRAGRAERAPARPLLRLDPHQQRVHRAVAGDDYAVFAGVSVQRVERLVDLARIDVLAAHLEHVVDAPVDAVGQVRIGAPAGARPVLPTGEIAREQADHRLRRALQVGIDRRPAPPVGDAREALRVADLVIDDVLPEQHARPAVDGSGGAHERAHLRHRPAVEHPRAVGFGDAVADSGDRRAGLAGEEHRPEAEAARIEPLLPRRLRQVQRVGRRAVEPLRAHRVEPRGGARGHPRRPGAEGERLAAEPLRPRQRPPGAEIEAEDRGDEHPVAGAQPHRPHDARVALGDGAPVAAADAERGRAPGRPRRAVDAMDLARRDAQVIAERRMRRLRFAQLRLRHRRHPLERLQRRHMVRMHPRLVPLAAVERRMLPGVRHDLAQAGDDGRLARAGVHRLAFGEPVARARRGQPRVVVAGRERPVLHVSAAPFRPPGGGSRRRWRRAACPGAAVRPPLAP